MNISGGLVQPPPHCRTQVVLGKKARVSLQLHHREKATHFKKDIDAAWQKLNNTTKLLEATHGKSVRCVENDLHIGHSRLHVQQSKINPWYAFCWKIHQNEASDADRENGKIS